MILIPINKVRQHIIYARSEPRPLLRVLRRALMRRSLWPFL